MGVIIRRAQANELDRVAEIALECFPRDYTVVDGQHQPFALAQQWVKGRDALYPFSLTFVAQEDEHIRGYVFYLMLGGVSSVVELEAIGVASAHRRRGIGRQLMARSESQVIDHLRQSFNIALSRIMLTTAAGNPDSHHLYQSQGYILSGSIGHLYWDQEEVVYIKDFTSTP